MQEVFKQQMEKIRNQRAEIAIIGLGYIGLPLAHAVARAGFPVTGLDIDDKKIELINGRKSYFKHIPDEQIGEMVDTGNFTPSTDFSLLSQADVIIICLPTPLNKYREPDLSYIENSVKLIRDNLQRGQLVILESTTYPGTSDELIKPLLEESGMTCGEEFFLAYSPEREDPGNPLFNTRNIPKVVGGYGEESTELADAFYTQIVSQTVRVSTLGTAEAVKLTENIFRSVNIALVNELKTIFDRMGINVWEVIEAASSKPFGFMRFEPGPGWGGHCIPVDPFYLTWKAREYGLSTRFIEIAGEINVAMPKWIVQKLWHHLNAAGKSIQDSKVLLIGVAYKKNVDDQRESPALVVLDELHDLGARITYHDPYISEIKDTRDFPQWAGMESVELSKEMLASQDAVIIVTDHSNVDYELIAEHAPLVLDSRGIYFKEFPELHARVIDV